MADGYDVEDKPDGSVIRAFDLQSGYQLCQGGSFNLARGLIETYIAAGGKFRRKSTRPHRDRRRQGDRHRTKDGRTVRARQFVASAIDMHQTFESMIGREQLPAAFAKKSTVSSTPSGRCSGCTSR